MVVVYAYMGVLECWDKQLFWHNSVWDKEIKYCLSLLCHIINYCNVYGDRECSFDMTVFVITRSIITLSYLRLFLLDILLYRWGTVDVDVFVLSDMEAPCVSDEEVRVA